MNKEIEQECYKFTEKIRLSTLSAIENEKEISKGEYDILLSEADADKVPIEKTRYSFSYDKHIVEIDIYPFWHDRAILEIELASESEEYSIPSFISVIKNVSDDPRYKNARLAKSIVFDKID